MELALPPAHRLARINYAPRAVAFAMTFVLLVLLSIERGRFNALECFLAVLTFLVYPHIAYLHARIAMYSKRAELNNLYADCVLLGAWTAQIHFALWPGVCMLAAVSLNSAAHGHSGRLFRSLAAFGVAAAAWGAVTGYAFKPDTGPLVTALCIFGIQAYLAWVGALVFMQNKNLLHTQSTLRTSEEQFRFIAENVGDMVALLGTRGNILYASSSYQKHFAPDAVRPGGNWLLLVHPDDREEARSFLNKIAASPPGRRVSLRLVSATGAWRFVDCMGNPVRDDKGQLQMVVLVSHEVATFMHPVSDDIVAAKREFFSKEKQLIDDMQDRLAALDERQKSAPAPQFKSVEDIHRYIEALAARKAEDGRRSTVWRFLERTTLAVTLAGSSFNYYLLSVLDTINSLPQNDFHAVRATFKTSQLIVLFLA